MKQAPFKIFSTTQPNPLPHFTGTKDEVYTWLSENMYGPDGFEVYETATETAKPAREFLEENDPFVPKFYRMNPKTDDLLPNGRHLANGMRVLIEDSKKRINMEAELTEWETERALHNNRWCTVGALEVANGTVQFIGVYDDGTKMMRSFDLHHGWLVKIDSIRDSVNLHTDRYQAVFDAVKLSFAKHEELVSQHDYPADAIYNHIEDTTKQILGLL